jgi:hypothetical protein
MGIRRAGRRGECGRAVKPQNGNFERTTLLNWNLRFL